MLGVHDPQTYLSGSGTMIRQNDRWEKREKSIEGTIKQKKKVKKKKDKNVNSLRFHISFLLSRRKKIIKKVSLVQKEKRRRKRSEQ